MSVLTDLKNEIEKLEGAQELPHNAQVVFEIAKQIEKLPPNLPRELVFRAMVQAAFGKMELG